MHIKKGQRLYVRIDYRIDGKEFTRQDMQDHLTYVKNVAGERYFIGGGFSNKDGGMCLFEAESFEDAQKVPQSDPIIERGIYRYELYEWDLVVLLDNITGE